MLLAFAPIGQEFRVNSATAGNQGLPSVAVDADGDVVVAFSGPQPDPLRGGDIFVRRFSASGMPMANETAIGSLWSLDRHSPQVAVDADDDFIVAWIEAGREISLNVYLPSLVFAQCFTSTGAPRGSPFHVSGVNGLTPHTPSLAVDRDGDFVIAWNETGGRGDQVHVFARHYDASGAPKGGEFRVNGPTIEIDRETPSVAMDAAGNFLVAWQRQVVTHGTDEAVTFRGPYDIYARSFDAFGAPQGNEFVVNATTDGEQVAPTAAASAAGISSSRGTARGAPGRPAFSPAATARAAPCGVVRSSSATAPPPSDFRRSRRTPMGTSPSPGTARVRTGPAWGSTRAGSTQRA